MIAHADDCPANRAKRNEHSPCRGGDCQYALVKWITKAAESLLGKLNDEYDDDTYAAIGKLSEASHAARKLLRKDRKR